jgi:hypothetical protein
MTDSAVWIAALTGGTAVFASWVTSRGNARAARVQSESSALADRHNRIRQSQRAAYLDFLEQAHATGELYYRLGDVYAQLTDPKEQMARIQKVRVELRDKFDPLMRSTRVVLLEGPAPVADTAEAVKQAVADTNTALWMISRNEPEAHERFDAAHHVFLSKVDEFIESARTAMISADWQQVRQRWRRRPGVTTKLRTHEIQLPAEPGL